MSIYLAAPDTNTHTHAQTHAHTYQVVGFAMGSRGTQQWSQGALQTLTEYVHPPQQSLVYIEPLGVARHVPVMQHGKLLHLHQALVPEMVQHHLEYVSGLETAWRRTVVEAGAEQAAGATASQAAAAGKAVTGAVQRIARQVEQGRRARKAAAVAEEGRRAKKEKDEV